MRPIVNAVLVKLYLNFFRIYPNPFQEMIPSTGRQPSWALPIVRLKVPAVPTQCSFSCGVPTGSVVDPDPDPWIRIKEAKMTQKNRKS